MKLKQLAISTLTVALLISCNNDQVKAGHSETDDHAVHQTGEMLESGGDGLVLNQGKKWEMDEHTRNSFNKMAESFLNTDHASMNAQDLKQSGTALQSELDVLIKGCTMTGEAHNQLHVYLTGYIPAVQALSESGNLDDAKKVEHYLEIYDDYLE